jgi:capsular polysaccharide biosynthesis protein
MTLLDFLTLLKKRRALVITLPIIAALLCAGVCWGVLKNTYTASTTVYVLSSSSDETYTSSSSSVYSDLSASQMLSNDIATLAESDSVLSRAADDLGMSSFNGYSVSVTSGSATRVITISVSGPVAAITSAVANQITTELSTVAVDVMGVKSVNVIDSASTPSSPSGPNRPLYIALAALAGLFLASLIVIVGDLMNTAFKTPEEIEEVLGVPVIGRIPDTRKLR